MHTIKLRTALPPTMNLGTLLRDAASAAWRTARVWHRTHKTRRALEEMDPRMLADLGISRAQADYQLSRAPWELPPR